jgi:hypothetical protein
MLFTKNQKLGEIVLMRSSNSKKNYPNGETPAKSAYIGLLWQKVNSLTFGKAETIMLYQAAKTARRRMKFNCQTMEFKFKRHKRRKE